MIHIQYVCNSAGHTCRKISAGRSQNNGTAAGHIFQAMITAAFYNCRHTRITNTKALSGNAFNVAFSRCRAIQYDITDNNILARTERYILRRRKNQLAAGQSLSETVIGISFQPNRQSLWNKSTEGLTTASGRLHRHRIVCQPITETSCNFRTQNRTKAAMNTGNPKLLLMRLSTFK